MKSMMERRALDGAVLRPDAEVWRRVVEGDHDVFGELFDRHARVLYNYCFRRTADWALAEDLMSTAFLMAWRRRADVRLAGSSVLPWLYGVVTNLIRNQARSDRRGRAAIERVRESGLVTKPGGPVKTLAAGQPRSSIAPRRTNGSWAKNSRCWSGMKSRIPAPAGGATPARV